MNDLLATFIPSASEKVMLAAGGTLGAAFSFAFGENVTPLLWWLLIFVCADLSTGLYSAWFTSSYSSKKLFLGVAKKVSMFGIVALAHGLDAVFAPMLGIAFVQSITICAYCAGEFGSVIENLEKGGLGDAVPPVLRRLVRTLDERVEAHAQERAAREAANKHEGGMNGG